MKHNETCELINNEVRNEMEEAMLRAPSGLQNIHFTPWVGRSFGKDAALWNKRILILGESHYEWCKLCWRKLQGSARGKNLTCWCIAERVVGDDATNMAHWTKIENALCGECDNREARHRLWHSIAYYNYIQEIVGFGARVRPSTNMIEAARGLFLEVLNVLQPDLVIALGITLWTSLPEEDTRLSKLSAGKKSVERCTYQLASGKQTVACAVRHPSAGLGATWNPVLTKIIGAI